MYTACTNANLVHHKRWECYYSRLHFPGCQAFLFSHWILLLAKELFAARTIELYDETYEPSSIKQRKKFQKNIWNLIDMFLLMLETSQKTENVTSPILLSKLQKLEQPD